MFVWKRQKTVFRMHFILNDDYTKNICNNIKGLLVRLFDSEFELIEDHSFFKKNVVEIVYTQ